MNKLNITYDPNGKGEKYGIQFNGNLSKILKIIKLISKRNVTIPTSSHHGLYIRLCDYPYTLRLLYSGWTHDNSGNGKTTLDFILMREDWESRITVHGQTRRNQYGISIEEKQGFIKMLENVGFKVTGGWNQDNKTTSITVATDLDVNMVQDADLISNFVKELQSVVETYNELN